MACYPIYRGILSLLLFGLLKTSVWAQTPPPNLVVVLVVDQMRTDYIDTCFPGRRHPPQPDGRILIEALEQ